MYCSNGPSCWWITLQGSIYSSLNLIGVTHTYIERYTVQSSVQLWAFYFFQNSSTSVSTPFPGSQIFSPRSSHSGSRGAKERDLNLLVTFVQRNGGNNEDEETPGARLRVYAAGKFLNFNNGFLNFVLAYKMSCVNVWPSQLIRNLNNCEVARKKVFRGFSGIRTRGLCVRAAVLHQLSYEHPYTGRRQIYWVHQPVKGMKHRRSSNLGPGSLVGKRAKKIGL